MSNKARYYAIACEANIPNNIQKIMYQLASTFAEDKLVQRSGGNTSEIALHTGATILARDRIQDFAQVMLPWDGFNQKFIGNGNNVCDQKTAVNMAKRYLKGFCHLKPQQKLLVARQSYVLLGCNFKQHAEFLLCYTKNGVKEPHLVDNKSMEYILKLANSYNIRIYNFGDPDDLQLASAWIERKRTKHTTQ